MHKDKIVADDTDSNLKSIRININKCIYRILKKFINESLRFCINAR